MTEHVSIGDNNSGDGMDKIRQWIGFDKNIKTPEQLESEHRLWGESLLTTEYDGSPLMAATLSVCGAPEDTLYTYVRYHSDIPFAVIPLHNSMSDQELINRLYVGTTFFGKVDDKPFKDLTTTPLMIDPLMAFLNKKALGEREFYTAFDVRHLEPYGDVYIGSQGGAHTFRATIDLRKRMGVIAPAELASKVSLSLPHLTLEPLSKDKYLEAIRTIPFLPEDWNIQKETHANSC
jgi:hypothetical protein